MTDDASQAVAPARTGGRGVVDPLTIPGASAAGTAWRRLPLLARLFLGLTVVDIIGRAVGLLGPLAVDLAVPMTLLTAFLPHDALILLPAIILARRPDAADATPLILGGAVVLAVTEFVGFVVGNMPIEPGRDSLLTWTMQSALGTMLNAAGWLAIAVGLSRLTPPYPRPSVEGLANLVGFALGVGAAAWLLELLLASRPSIDADSSSGLVFIASAMVAVRFGVWAYLGRVVVLGIGDARRSQVAVVTAAVAMTVAAVGAAILSIEALAVAAQTALNLGTGFMAGSASLGWFGDGAVVTALVVALGLGLGDNSVRMPKRGTDPGFSPTSHTEDEPLRWPTPGGDVPAFRAPEPSRAPATKPSRKRGRKKESTT